MHVLPFSLINVQHRIENARIGKRNKLSSRLFAQLFLKSDHIIYASVNVTYTVQLKSFVERKYYGPFYHNHNDNPLLAIICTIQMYRDSTSITYTLLEMIA